MDISTLTLEEIRALSDDLKQREYELTELAFERFFQSEDFKHLCKISAAKMQEKLIEVTVTVPVLVSVATFKEETRIDIIARDKESLIANSKMIEVLDSKPEVQKMRSAALEADSLFDAKVHEFIDKYELNPALAWMKIVNRISRVSS